MMTGGYNDMPVASSVERCINRSFAPTPPVRMIASRVDDRADRGDDGGDAPALLLDERDRRCLTPGARSKSSSTLGAVSCQSPLRAAGQQDQASGLVGGGRAAVVW